MTQLSQYDQKDRRISRHGALNTALDYQRLRIRLGDKDLFCCADETQFWKDTVDIAERIYTWVNQA